MSQAYTVTPQLSETGDYLGSEVTASHGGYQSSKDDYVQTSEGLKHHFQEVELQDPNESFDRYQENQFFETVLEAYPSLGTALSWATQSGHWEKHQFETFVNARDADDHATMMPMVERLVEDFANAAPPTQQRKQPQQQRDVVTPQVQVPQEQPTYDDYQFDDEGGYKFSDEEIDSLKSEVPGGEEVYDEMTSWAAEFLTDEQQNAFDEIMDIGNPEQCRKAIKALYKMFYNHSEED